MEKLQLQQACFENIKALCSNYKKDSSSRKTEEYLIKRLESLEAQWNDFEERHAILEQVLEDKNINYFVDNVYSKTQAQYKSTKGDMLNLLEQLQGKKFVEFDLTGMLDQGTNDTTKTLLSRQECNFKALDRAMSKIDIKSVNEKWELEDHLSILRSKWNAVDKQHWELEALLKGSNGNYYNMFVDMEDKYDELRKNLNSKIWSTVHYEKSAPKIEVPEFSGSYTQWISFKDLFVETIHNNPMINKAQKMQHLKTRLRGEAERLVQHLSIGAENYTSCWEILTQRFDNRRLQFTSFLNTMLNLPVIQQPDSFNLKKMHDVITECTNGLSNIGLDIATWDPIIVHLMSQKLDTTTYSEYIKELRDPRDVPNLNELLYFLENKFMAYETMKNTKKEVPNQQKQVSSKPFNKHNYAKLHDYERQKSFKRTYHTAYGRCPYCEGNHVLMKCPKFINMDSFQRNNTVEKLHVCKNCLYSHGNTECASAKTCKECDMKHHTLLHNADKKNTANSTKTERNNDDLGQRPTTSTYKQSSNHISTNEMEVLLTTVQLKIKSANGDYITLRALLDQGSQVNLITENAAQMLRLPRKRLNAIITGVGAAPGNCKGRLQLTCKSIHSDYAFETQALILSKLTNNLPNSSFEKANWPHLENLKLADPEFNVSSPIDLLLGADVYSDIILDGVLKGSQQSPVAQQTHLGWILCGKLKTFNCHITQIDLTELNKFWENEDITISNHDMPKDNQCEEYYTKTVQRDTDNKYIVKMPMSSELQNKLGKSKSMAISQFLQLEKRLGKNNKLATMYRDFIREYTQLQHMKPASPILTSMAECYLPHHGVLREQSTTTKLRVVFNASQRTTTGYSLNSLMEKGPNLQKDIQALILKWRSYKYAFTADIEKMYRCIGIAEDQQSLQKIIWHDSPTERLQEFQLCTVTYGTKCAPWLAMRTMKQLALDDGHKYPEAANTLLNEFYVDDVISGHYSLDKAKDLQSTLINLLKGGGMNLRKWSANHPALLESLTDDQISTKSIFDFKTEDSTKTLGLGWNPNIDTFMFNWNLEETSKGRTTKRHLLSEISKLYDPLGWLAPITVSAKLLFQRVWNSKLAWDEELPSGILNDWAKLKTELPHVRKIKLNRWIGAQQSIELLGFCDASEKAYACVIYSRVRNEQDNTPTVTLLVAKTRVAPLSQKTTLPRLELCGALLLTKLMEKTTEALAGYNLSIKAWCDSQVVLAWLQGDASRWDKYVSNRVDKIKQIIPSDKWHYVKSAQNPADCASRGMLPSKLINFDLWWQGPEFLKGAQDSDFVGNSICLFTTNQESVTLTEATTTVPRDNEHFINNLLHKYSSLTQVIRVTAQVLRFVATARSRMKFETNYLSVSELKLAADRVITYVQSTEFENEYKQLKGNGTVNNKSIIYKLNPCMDEKGVIRVGGRLKNSYLPFEMKNPIILPRTGRLTQLVIEQAHLTTLHGGARLTLAQIRQQYWIVGSNRAVKTQLRLCVRCHRYKPTDNHQLMADLPQQRVTPSRPFTHTGVDFTGHVQVKLNKGRGVKTTKGYIAIFVCMATKAVHIELVSDLSTETFIAAFQRMCARRGTPKHVYSDCGTNFIGASKVLRNEFEHFKKELSPDFFIEIGKMEVEWHFNAPAWPSAGGLWEAAVKSMKHHLHRVLGDQKLTFEEFTTLLAKIEACMNSRPLCPLTEDPGEFQNYLTPGHFLTGSPTMSLPISTYCDVNNVNLRQRWQLTEHMLHQFWKSWSSEYLTQLQIRGKWNKPKKNIQEGDIVLIKDNNLPPGKWAMGRVLELHPGSDGYVRVTTVKTQSGIIKRPVVKLSPLPIENNVQDHSERKTPTMPKTGNKCLSTLLTMLLIVFTLITGSYGDTVTSGVQITNFELERPIYYDTIGNVQVIHDEWTLLMYYNLTTYWDGVRRIEAYLKGLNELCQKTDPRYCKTTLEQLNHEMEILSYYNNILLAPHKHLSNRKKRGLIDGVGYVANSLFGILDQRFADKYHNDIQAIQNNENYLLDLVRNQTSIVEIQNNMLKKNEKNIMRQFGLIDDFMAQTNTNLAKVESEIEIVMATNYFNSASLTAYLLITNLERVQEMLFESLTDVYKGHIDIHLLTPVDLIEQLTEIAGKLPRTSSLPVRNIRNDIKDLYKLLYVRARVTTNYFLFEIHVPLISGEDFTLYQATPLPMKTSTGTVIVQLASQYIAVDFGKSTYISLSEDDMKRCNQIQPGNLICNKNLPIFNLHNSNAPCEAKLLGHRTTSPCDVKNVLCKQEWIALHTANTWLAICCGTCTIRIVCENDITTHSMTSGLLTLAQGCLLQSKELTIHSHNQYNSNMKMDLSMNIPSLNSMVNNIVNVTHNMSHVMLPETAELEEIDKRLAVMKTQENHLPSTISTHDIHQYAVSYTIVGVLITVAVGWLVKIYGPSCRSKQTKSHSATNSRIEEIELQPIQHGQQEEYIHTASQAELQAARPRHADNIAFNFE